MMAEWISSVFHYSSIPNPPPGLLGGTLKRQHAVGDLPAQPREPAAMGRSERVVALVRCCLAHGGAARL